jgi:hypothetical protein
VVAAARVTGQTAANSNIVSFVVGGTDGTFHISMDASVTAASAISTSLNCSYTDDTNTSRVMIIPVAALAGNFLSGGLITATGVFESAVMEIRAKAATTITLYTATGTFTSVTYAAGGVISQMA